MEHSRIEEVTFIFKDRYKNKDYFTPQQFWLRISSDSQQNLGECIIEISNSLDGSLLISYDDPQLSDVRKIHDMGGIFNCVIVDTSCDDIGNYSLEISDKHWLDLNLWSILTGIISLKTVPLRLKFLFDKKVKMKGKEYIEEYQLDDIDIEDSFNVNKKLKTQIRKQEKRRKPKRRKYSEDDYDNKQNNKL